MSAQSIIGLYFETEDAVYGAPITFFKIGRYTVDLISNITQVTFRGFASQTSAALGRTPLSYPTIEVQGVPNGVDAAQWIYAQTAASAGHALAGATTVIGEVVEETPASEPEPDPDLNGDEEAVY